MNYVDISRHLNIYINAVKIMISFQTNLLNLSTNILLEKLVIGEDIRKVNELLMEHGL